MRLNKILPGLLAALVLGSPAVASYQVTFGDLYANWPGTPYTSMSKDENGIPIFPTTGTGVVELSDTNQLLSIQINYQRGLNGRYDSLWYNLRAGDLFLDTDTVPGWDYIVRSPLASDTPVYTLGVVAAGDWSVFKLNSDLAVDATGSPEPYLFAGDAKTRFGAPWTHIGIVREDHPWAINGDWLADNATLVGTADFSGWLDLPLTGAVGTSTFTFDGITLDLSHLTFAFTVNCANDVLYVDVPLQEPTGEVPEPASLLIWAVLGLSFAGGSWRLAYRRRWTYWDDNE